MKNTGVGVEGVSRVVVALEAIARLPLREAGKGTASGLDLGQMVALLSARTGEAPQQVNDEGKPSSAMHSRDDTWRRERDHESR